MKRTAWLWTIFGALLALAISGTVLAGKRAAETAPPLTLSTVLVLNGTGHGSGVHIGDGLIVTAAHVVRESKIVDISDSLLLTQKGDVLWVDKDYDIALIRIQSFAAIKASPLECVTPAPIGSEIQAVGHPGELRYVHTWGRVSATAGKVGPWKMVFIADLTIAPGMSGGPVLNVAGHVVGISVGVPTHIMGTSMPGVQARSLLAISLLVPASTVCELMAERQ